MKLAWGKSLWLVLLISWLGISSAWKVQAQPYGFIAGTASGRIAVFDLASNQAVGFVTVVSGSPNWGRGVAMTPDRTKVFVSFRDANLVGVISVDTTYTTFPTLQTTIPMATGAGPYGISPLPDGSKMYVSNELNGTVSVIDVATNTIDTSFFVGGRAIGMAVTPDGSRLMVPCRENPTANYTAVYSIPGHTLIANIPGINEPYGIELSHDGTRAYIMNRSVDAVQVIDVASATVLTTVGVGDAPTGGAVSQDDQTLYVTNSGDGTVSVVDVSSATPSLTATISVNATPWDASISPDGTYLHVASFGDNAVTVINTNTNTVESTAFTWGPSSPNGNLTRRPVGYGDFMGAYYASSPVGTPFPVEWLQFDAYAHPDGIQLSWGTAQEINNQAFEIDRSVDGRNWQKVGTVPGVGTTAEPQWYQFTDHSAQLGQPYYYRLRQVDLDGQFSFSPRVSATIPMEGNTRLFVEAKTQRLRITHTGAMGELMDLSGRTLKAFPVHAGDTWIDLGGLPVGVYLLRLTHPDGWVETHKVLK